MTCQRPSPQRQSSAVAGQPSSPSPQLHMLVLQLTADVMDGHFVPNITMGAPILACVKKNIPDIFMDCHMMVSKPSQVSRKRAGEGRRYSDGVNADCRARATQPPARRRGDAAQCSRQPGGDVRATSTGVG